MLKKMNQKGFTIIEVLIVLAIAGLIMLVIFLAVPALQRSQRNSARQNDANLLIAAINDCVTNRNGVVASCSSSGPNAVVVPTNPNQLTTAPTYGAGTGSTTQATWRFGFTCSADGLTDVAATPREFLVRYRAETSSSGDTARCIPG